MYGLLNVDARYLIVGPTRSGTTALSMLIGGHPEVSSLGGELRFSKLVDGLEGFTMAGFATEEAKRLGRAFLFDAITSTRKDSLTRVLGAKTCCNSKNAALQLLNITQKYLPGIKIIVSVRHDYVAHYGSRFKLQKTGVAHSWETKDESAQEKMIQIDKWLLARSSLSLMETYDTLRKATEFTDYYEVNYEEFANDNDKVYRNILDFLDLKYVEPEWMIAKRLHPDPSLYIKDYSELTQYITDFMLAYQEKRVSQFNLAFIKIYSRLRKGIHFKKKK